MVGVRSSRYPGFVSDLNKKTRAKLSVRHHRRNWLTLFEERGLMRRNREKRGEGVFDMVARTTSHDRGVRTVL